MIDCSRYIHYEVCSNRFSNDGCEGTCGFYLQDIRPHGEWKITEAYPHKVYCGKCFKTYAQEDWEVWKDGGLPRNFCPNCGAVMRKKLQTPSCLTNPERQAELLERYKEE